MNLDDFLSLAQAHNWLGVAMVAIAYLTYLLSPASKFPLTLDPNARWLRWLGGRDPRPFVALLLGATYGVLGDREVGHSWADSLKLGLAAGLLTMGAVDVASKFVFNGNVPDWLKTILLLMPVRKTQLPPPPAVPKIDYDEDWKK